MVCAEFTAHGLNNSLKIYSVDKSEPISTLRFLQPFQFSCLMAGQWDHVVLFLTHELIQALWLGKFALLVAYYAQMLF